MESGFSAYQINVHERFIAIFKQVQAAAFATVDLNEIDSINNLAELLNLTKDEVLVTALVYALQCQSMPASEKRLTMLCNSVHNNEKPVYETLQGLKKFDLIHKSYGDDSLLYEISRSQFSNIRAHKYSAIAGLKPVGLEKVLIYFNNKLMDDEDFSCHELFPEYRFIAELNPDLLLVKQTIEVLRPLEAYLVLALCCKKYLSDEPFNTKYLLDNCSDKGMVRVLFRHIIHEEIECMKQGYVRLSGGELSGQSPALELTESGVMHFMADLYTDRESALNLIHTRLPSHAILPKAIAPVKLYFDAAMTQRVHELETLLKPEFYLRYLDTLRPGTRMRGLTVLLHGAPGTGKTELALQLARKSGRALFRIDMSQLLSKWVGDSEKNLRARFTEYRRYQAQIDPAPILFLNECDQLLSRRMAVTQSVDQMRNTLQNMLLEEMENFHGILLATTNMTQNLDPAFERRFLYKVRFQAPDLSMRSQLWKAILPRLRPEQAEQLAAQFPFSPGEMQNIVTKLNLRRMLNPKGKYFETVLGLCREEKWGEEKTTRMGFKSI
jgi:hypothetical protein